MSHQTDTATPLNTRPPITQVETLGIDTIPDKDRTSSWKDLLRIQFGGADTFATVLLGTFSVALGLSFWQAVAAVVTGLAVGIVILMTMGLYGPQTGTNNAVSSGALLGVRGRIVGSFLSLLTAISFYSISVWVGGDAIVGAFERLLGVSGSDTLRIILYGIIGAIVIVVVIFGYEFMAFVNKLAVYLNTILMLLGVFAFWTVFNAGYAPPASALALGSFWPTFIAAALIAMSNPVSFGAFLGDWSRYIPRDTPRSKLLLATVIGQSLTLIPYLFGVATATIVAGSNDYVVALINASPGWYALLLIVVAFIGGLSTGTTSLYGTGLDFSSVFPRFSRVQSTAGIGILAFLFILSGRLFFDLLGAVNAFVGAIIVMTTPWMIIMIIGFLNHRGTFSARDLQVFNKGEVGGIYWYALGMNWRGLGAWFAAAFIGLMFANYPPVIKGPFRDLAGGIDLSLVLGISSAAILYLLALWIWPEPRYAYGPAGALFAPTKADASLIPIRVNDHAMATKARKRREQHDAQRA